MAQDRKALREDRQRSAKDDEYELATACASLATMYFALALDAAHFGELPEL
jgi:hypothetical protein